VADGLDPVGNASVVWQKGHDLTGNAFGWVAVNAIPSRRCLRD
jgi:hypothetical protein